MASPHTTTGPWTVRWRKLLLVAGFFALAGALLLALGSPATGYERSIYRSTPLLFWPGTAVAFLAALVVGFGARGRYGRLTAVVLGACSALAVVGLPLLRGYYFYGRGDALTHLGFARAIAGGALQPGDLFAPGVHVLSVVLNAVTGLAPTQSMMLTVVVFFGLFFVFVPLCVREMADTRTGLVVGLFSAVLLLPINGLGTHVVVHPSSEAILLAPFLLFLGLLALRLHGTGGFRPTRPGLVFALVAPAMLFVDPHGTLTLLVLLGAVVAVQVAFRALRSTHPIAQHKPLYFETLVLGVIWVLWTGGRSHLLSYLQAAADLILGGGIASPGHLAAHVAALPDVWRLGGLFLKLFLVAVVFAVVAGVVMVGSPLGRFDEEFPEYNAFNKYLTAAVIPLVVIACIALVRSLGDYFRLVGFLMLPVTLVGAVALARGVPLLRSRLTRTGHRRVLILLFAVLLPLAMLSLHPSPWIGQANPQVTEGEMAGYGPAIAHRVPNTTFASPRDGGDQFPSADWRSPTGLDGEGTYVPLRSSDWQRDVSLPDGLDDPAGFQMLRTMPGVHRIQSTGGFELYYVSDG